MSPGERAAPGRRDTARPQLSAPTSGFQPSYYHQPYGAPQPSAWLGAPLISMAGRAPQQRHTPISKLAVQARGAPLIIQNRPDRRRFTAAPEQRGVRSAPPSDQRDVRPRNQHQPLQTTRAARGDRIINTDAVSVASDESSGSNNSETMLPRIIKPRKRRKKDRKPNNMTPHELSAPALDVDSDRRCDVAGVPSAQHSAYGDHYSGEMQFPYRLNVKVFEYPDSVPDSYKVSALGEALEATRFGAPEAISPAESAVSSCQCRYCDPVGQIWDADSVADLLDESSSGDFAPTKLEESMKAVGSLGKRADSTLRRSWSDPFARTPEKRDMINYSEPSTSAPNLYSLFPPSRRAISPREPRSPLALEISSEIVTSMNGHRDLEIKLFSSSPPAVSSGRPSFFSGNIESVVGSREVSVVNSDKTGRCDQVNGTGKCEEVSDSGCSSAFNSAEFSKNRCDLALVTV